MNSQGVREFSGQTIVVAGAATGIGAAAAHKLAALGAAVVGLDLNGPSLAQTFSEFSESGLTVEGVQCDCSDQDAINVTFAGILERYNRIDVLVNCVGITGLTAIPAHEVPIADFDRVLTVNLRSALILSQAVIPGMLAQEYGRILHVASIAGKEGNPGMVSYSASKAGLIGMVKSMAKDYAKLGVTVNALAPAVIMTPLVAAMPQSQVDLNVSKIPMGRLGTLDEASDLIAWIVSPRASFTTGFTYDLSGGRATY